jgi:hypothetical protein
MRNKKGITYGQVARVLTLEYPTASQINKFKVVSQSSINLHIKLNPTNF